MVFLLAFLAAAVSGVLPADGVADSGEVLGGPAGRAAARRRLRGWAVDDSVVLVLLVVLVGSLSSIRVLPSS